MNIRNIIHFKINHLYQKRLFYINSIHGLNIYAFIKQTISDLQCQENGAKYLTKLIKLIEFNNFISNVCYVKRVFYFFLKFLDFAHLFTNVLIASSFMSEIVHYLTIFRYFSFILFVISSFSPKYFSKYVPPMQ